jgi:secreted trypsin-like serine protease
MNEPVDFSDTIQPACLPQAGVNTTNVQGTVVGHGRHSRSSNYENRPKHGEMTTISEHECVYMSYDYLKIVSRTSFCARGDAVGPCSGDSGGGFFVKDSETGQFEVHGVVSQGVDATVCNTNDYTVFTDVPQFIEWIKTRECFCSLRH